MNLSIETIWLVIVSLWLFVLSFLIWKLYSRFISLFKGSHDQTVTAVLSRLVKENEIARKDIDSLIIHNGKIEEKIMNHIQKVGLLRFNPFHNTGGEQSFILALLDTQDSGIVISGLYARSGMRWYVKKIVQGNGDNMELSEEEKKAIAMAK